MNNPWYWDISIVVVAGAGTTVLTKTGRIERTVVTGPNGATFSITINDKDGKPITARTSTASQLVFVEDYQALTSTSFIIASATADGTYTVRLWRKDGASFR